MPRWALALCIAAGCGTHPNSTTGTDGGTTDAGGTTTSAGGTTGTTSSTDGTTATSGGSTATASTTGSSDGTTATTGTTTATSGATTGTTGSPPTPGPTATIVFPPALSLTSLASLHVRGTAASASTITSVTVNGVAASTTDGFAHWVATVPLAIGSNTLIVATADNAGGATASAATVTTRRDPALLAQRTKLAYHSGTHTLLLSNEHEKSLIKHDTQTGIDTLILSEATGTAFPTGSQRVFAPDDPNVVYVLGGTKLYRVVLAAKTITEIAPPATTLFTTPVGIAIDPTGATAYVSDAGDKSIIKVTLGTGVQTVFSRGSPQVGGGTSTTAFYSPNQIAYDTKGTVTATDDRLLVLDTGDGGSNGPRIIEVRVSDGQRTIFSDNSHGSGGSYGLPRLIAMGAGAYPTTAFVAIPQNGYLFSVDLATGNHPIFMRESLPGTGLDISSTSSIAFDPSDDALIVADDDNIDLVKATDADHLPSGDAFKTAYLDFGLGTGPPLVSARAAVFDATRSRLLAALDRSPRKLAAIAPNGDRTDFGTAGQRNNLRFDRVNDFIYATDHTGNGSLVKFAGGDGTATTVSSGATAPIIGSSARSLAIDVANDRAWIVTGDTTLVSIVLSTGARASVTVTVGGVGNHFGGIAYDAVGSRLLFTNQNQNALFAVPAAGGTATKLSGGLAGSVVGNGAASLSNGSGIYVNAAGTKAWVMTLFWGLVSVDLATGDRTEVSGPNVGAGPPMTTGLSHFDIDETANLAVVPSSAYLAVFIVDLDSGDRVLVSQ